MKRLEIKALSDTLEVYVYGEIGESFWSERSTAAMDIVDALADGEGRPVTVHLNSPGGSVNDALAIFNALSTYDAEVTTQIDGVAYSAASLIAMAGDTVSMAENALLMIHAPHTVVEGNAQEMAKAVKVLEAYSKAMTASYTRGGRIDAETIAGWLGDGEDHYFTAQEAYDLNLIDSIGPALAVAAMFRTSGETMDAPNKPPVQPVDTTQAERERVSAIHELFALPSAAVIPTDKRQNLLVRAVKEGQTEAQASRALLAALPHQEPAGGDPVNPQTGASIVLGRDALDGQAAGIGDALAVRMSADPTGEIEARVRQSEFMGMSAVEMARRCLESAGVSVRGMNRNTIMGQALTIRNDRGVTHTGSDFPALVEVAVNKAVLRGWDEAPETWSMIARQTSIPDFRPAPRSGLGSYPTLPEVPEGGEYSYATISDRKETIVLLTYGSLMGVTRQLLINDDLGQLGSIGARQGRAAARRVGDLVYLVLTGNPTMEQTGNPLFDAAHNNLATVTGPPRVDTLDNMRVLMGLQKDDDENAHGLNLRPRKMVVPLALETQANVLRASQYDPDSTSRANSRAPNPFQNTYDVVADPRLDDASSVVWYTTEDPQTFDVIEAGFLEGASSPYLESKAGWTVDGQEFKVRIDCAAIPLDFRTMARNAGA